MECGASGIRLDVHHLDEITEQQREEKDEGAAYPSPDRLRVLCVSCHSMETRGIRKQNAPVAEDGGNS